MYLISQYIIFVSLFSEHYQKYHYKNPDFQKLFEDTVAVMARSHKESRWPVAPSSLSSGQRKFLKELISGDSLRVQFYLEALDRSHTVNIPLDTDKRLSSFSDK